MQTKQGVSVVDGKFEKHHLHYDMEKGAFVKSKRNPVHYIV